MLGQEREYLTIKILHNDMTVNVPSENAEKVGLRWVIDEQMVEVVVKTLTGVSTEMPKNWNRRFKHNRDKMKTGDILELAEVVRNLALRDRDKGLSTGEKQMFVKAKKILASELMYAKEMSEEQAAEWLDEVVARPAVKRAAKAKPKAATASGLTGGAALSLREERHMERVRCPPSVPGDSRKHVGGARRGGVGERLGADRPKAFVGLGGRPLLAESLERLDRSRLGRRHRRRRAAWLGGADDPAGRGDRGGEGDRRRRRGKDESRFGARGPC